MAALTGVWVVVPGHFAVENAVEKSCCRCPLQHELYSSHALRQSPISSTASTVAVELYSSTAFLQYTASTPTLCPSARGVASSAKGATRHKHLGAALCRTQNSPRDDSPLASRAPFKRLLFVSTRSQWPHEAPEAAQPLRCPRNRMLVRCCTPSTRHALSAAAVWPPSGLPGAPLLENAS